MDSTGDYKAMGLSPPYDVNLSENYHISFSFLIPHIDNHWFEVFNNHQIYLLIDEEDDLKCYDGDDSYMIDELTTNQWYPIDINVHPSSKTYDVYVYFKGEESQSTLHIKEESLIWFIEEESLHNSGGCWILLVGKKTCNRYGS